jgi:hypothetical protein
MEIRTAALSTAAAIAGGAWLFYLGIAQWF